MSLAPAKTLKEELVSTKLESTADVQLSNTTTNNPFNVYKEHFQLYIQYENTKTKNDPITSEADFWTNNIDTFESFEPEFILFWMRKLANANPKVLELVKGKINIEETALQTLSDSIANIFDQDLVVDSRYTPMFDVDLESNNPLPYNHILDSKLNFNYKKNVSQMSTKVNSLFNQNISKIVQPSSPGVAHGGNLVTDFTHINRIAENKPSFYEIVADKLDGSFETFVFLSNYKLNNLQEVIKVEFDKDVEGTTIKVDLKGDRIQTPSKKKTKELLG
jgi:hypothetical protein